MRIGVFDTGRGGEFVADRLREIFPRDRFVVVNDQANAPYGDKTTEEIIPLTDYAIQPLLTAQCDPIIIACNTATAAAIDTLRQKYPSIRFIGFEPMIKPAAIQSKTKRVILLATTATRRSARYQTLISKYGADLHINTPDTRGWASRIDSNESASIDLTEVIHLVNAGADTIVLACTHYKALEDRLSQLFPDVIVLEPTDAVAKQLLG